MTSVSKPRGAGRARFASSLLPVALLLAFLLFLMGCSSDEVEDPDTTARPATGDTSASEQPPGVQRGGTVRIGSQSATNLDPHFSTSIADILMNHQIYDWLVEIDAENQPVPALAESWERNEDGTVWTFRLVEGVTFHDGSDFGAEDVVYTFQRLSDPDVGTPVTSLFESLDEVVAVDPLTVEFRLSRPNPEFPGDVADYHNAVLSSEVDDPARQQIGTGPFKLVAHAPEDRAVLEANGDYWKTGEDGEPLPYVDELQFVFSPDLGGQVGDLQDGDLHYVGGLTAELAELVAESEELVLLTVTSNMHFVIHMRSDVEPASDNRVRRALKLGTDHQAIIDAVRPGLAVAGNGFTPVGPSYGDYYYDLPPERDTEEAMRLLEQAGYDGDLEITLVVQQALDIPAIATVWKEQMAEIGVTVDIEAVPSDVYYGDGERSWLQVPFGITEWGTRATPVNYFQLAYIPGSRYNESHWENDRMAELTRAIETEVDRDLRVDLYHQVQQLMIEEGPVIVPYFEAGVAGVTRSLEGVELATDSARTLFREAYLAP